MRASGSCELRNPKHLRFNEKSCAQNTKELIQWRKFPSLLIILIKIRYDANYGPNYEVSIENQIFIQRAQFLLCL